jgi:RNA polymerase sigma factor (TIGR02999 family)
MAKTSSQEITQMLLAWSDGDETALHTLIPLVHEELHRLAHHYMAGERPDHSLQSTALVNEACLRLMGCKQMTWQNRAHFFAVCAQLMRRILVDHARSRLYQKRGAGKRPLSLDEAVVVSNQVNPDLVVLDDALTALALIDQRKGRVVELRFFGGLNVQETAEVLKVSPITVKREWRKAKAWLQRELSREERREA